MEFKGLYIARTCFPDVKVLNFQTCAGHMCCCCGKKAETILNFGFFYFQSENKENNNNNTKVGMVTEGIIVSKVITGGAADLKGLKTHDQVVKVSI